MDWEGQGPGAGNGKSANCGHLNTGLSTMGGSRSQEETKTGDNLRKDAGWVGNSGVAGGEMGRMKTILSGPSA